MQGELDKAGKLYGKEWNEALEKGIEEELKLGEVKDNLSKEMENIAIDLQDLFSDIDFGDDGIINTFSELKEAFESIDQIFEDLASAREEQNASG